MCVERDESTEISWYPDTQTSLSGATKLKEPAMATHRETKSMTLRLDEPLAETVQAIAEVEGSTVSDVIRDALTEHVKRRRVDPKFQQLLQRNLERHAKLLSMLADG